MVLKKTEEDLRLYGDKCNFYEDTKNRAVICSTTYKNEKLRAVARCNPIEEEYSLASGKKLSYRRCMHMLAKKKLAHAKKVYKQAEEEANRARRRANKALVFLRDSEDYFIKTFDELKETIKELGE